ncbi:MAG TPA: serine hydrolase domain-containing protein, partial [Caulobacteraceae bacterium]|nr:serine hydrolase domain-containing protein [Caulobacteraceae bacterium]
LTPVFSTTKAIAAIMLGWLVGQGRLGYGQRVAEIWPEFAQAGKAGITVEQCLSHQDGLAAFVQPMDPDLWYDWDAITSKIAAMAPLWPPGTASGYHPVTYGYIAGEIFRRVDGRTIGTALRREVAEPLGLDIWIGLPDSEHGRVAAMQRPSAMPDLGPLTEIKRAAFLEPWSSPGGRDTDRWRRAEIPSANGHATADSLARLAAVLACDGMLEGRQVLEPGIAAELSRQRIRGQDLVLPYDLAWGAGVLRNDPVMIYGPGAHTVGHSGWGGSCLMADPERRLSAAYVMNRQSPWLIGDPRARRLIEAVYAGA